MLRTAVVLALVAVAACLAWLVLREPPPSATTDGARIVSLSPTLTETVYDLGAGHLLAGVTSYCNYPAEAKRVERIGDFISPNTERIVALNPTLVLAERWTSSRIVPKLRGVGLRVVETTSPTSIGEIDRLIEQVGEALGRREQARHLIRQMHTRIAAVQEKAAKLRYHPSVYLEIDPPSWTVGRKSYTSEAISLAGGRNLFDDMDIASLLASKEEIVRRNPDLIIAFSARRLEVASRPGWDQIRAVREGLIIDEFNRDLLSRGSFRLVEGIEQLAVIIERAAVSARPATGQRAVGETGR